MIEIEHQDAQGLLGAHRPPGFPFQHLLPDSGGCKGRSRDRLIDWLRRASRSRMLATDSPTCSANVVFNDNSASRQSPGALVSGLKMQDAERFALRQDGHAQVRYSSRRRHGAHAAVVSPATTRCGCPVRRAQQASVQIPSPADRSRATGRPPRARLRSENRAAADAPRGSGKIFGAKPAAAANTSLCVMQLCSSSPILASSRRPLRTLGEFAHHSFVLLIQLLRAEARSHISVLQTGVGVHEPVGVLLDLLLQHSLSVRI